MNIISSGCLSLDLRLGRGFERGKIYELSGPPEAGKSSLALSIMKEATDRNQGVLYADLDNSFDKGRADLFGVGANMQYLSSRLLEDALDAIIYMASNLDIVVIDNLGAANTQDGHPNATLSKMLPDLMTRCNDTGTSVVLLNQLRVPLPMPGFTTSGGKAVRRYVSRRIKLARGEPISKDGYLIGRYVLAKVMKAPNTHSYVRTALPLYDNGFSYVEDLIEVAIGTGILKRSGSWIKYGDASLGVGVRDTAEKLIHTGQFEEIKERTLSLVWR
jgi:recombination protein RecA